MANEKIRQIKRPSHTATDEIILIRMSIEAIKKDMCKKLDDLSARIDKLLPRENAAGYGREKRKPWEDNSKKW